MKHKNILFTIAFMAVSVMGGMAQETFDLTLYNGSAPNDNGDPTDTAKARVYLPKESEATGRAVVICPGGGYSHLAIKKEGYDWAEFFRSNGIAAVVLKYRMPHGNPEVPISDAEQAMRLVRLNAASWHVKTDNVGIMGFSAGGHLASTIATQSTGDAKPDFQILFYPVITMMDGYGHEGSLRNFLGDNDGKKMQKRYSSDMHVTRVTPRAFIALSDDDNAVPPANGVNYYMELYRNDVRATLHVYPGGGHGWGSNINFKYHDEMLLDLKAWLRSF